MGRLQHSLARWHQWHKARRNGLRNMDKLAVLADLHQGNALLHPAGGGAVVDGGWGSGGLWEGWWCMMGGAVVDSGGRWEGQWWMVGGAVVDGGRGSGGWWEGWWWMMGGTVVDGGRGGGGQWRGSGRGGGGCCSHWHIGVHCQVVLGDERLVQGLLRSEARSITQPQEA